MRIAGFVQGSDVVLPSARLTRRIQAGGSDLTRSEAAVSSVLPPSMRTARSPNGALPWRVRSGLPVAASHSLMRLSCVPVTTVLPSGLKSAQITFFSLHDQRTLKSGRLQQVSDSSADQFAPIMEAPLGLMAQNDRFLPSSISLPSFSHWPFSSRQSFNAPPEWAYSLLPSRLKPSRTVAEPSWPARVPYSSWSSG